MFSPSAIQGVHVHISHIYFAIQPGNVSVASVTVNWDKDNTTATKNYSNIYDRFSYFLLTLFVNLQGVAFIHCTELGAMKLDAAWFPLILGTHEDILFIIKSSLILYMNSQTYFENCRGFFNVLKLFWGMEINTVNTANFLSNRLAVLLKWKLNTWGIPWTFTSWGSIQINEFGVAPSHCLAALELVERRERTEQGAI